MTLSDYQRMHALYMNEGDEIEQVAWVVCDMFGFSYEQVDNMARGTFLKYADRVKRIMIRAAKRPWWMPGLLFKRNAYKLTFGQFIEVQAWLQQGDIQALHMIAATICRIKIGGHEATAKRLGNANVRYSLQDVRLFLLSLKELVAQYKNLFESDEAEETEGPQEEQHPFILQYGWLFAAGEVARLEGITRDKAFDMPIVQALNSMAYLKAEANYRKHLSQK